MQYIIIKIFSTTRKMMDFIRSALSEESKEQIIQDAYVKEQQVFHGARAYAFITDYTFDRIDKQNYITEQITAQGYETEKFYALLANEKSKLTLLTFLELGPNVDFYTMQEIEALTKRFKEGGSSQEEEQKKEGDLLFENKDAPAQVSHITSKPHRLKIIHLSSNSNRI